MQGERRHDDDAMPCHAWLQRICNFALPMQFLSLSLQRIQCFLLGVIALILLIGIGHVLHLSTSDDGRAEAELLLNLSKQMNQEMKLIRKALTRNDYQDPQVRQLECRNKPLTRFPLSDDI